MQRITNLLAIQDGQVLLLQKPRRGWYVAPGGKMESGESILQAAVREFYEETNAKPIDPQLKGVFTIIIKENGEVIDEWMLFTFVAFGIEGTPYEENREGKLGWHPIEAINHLPMAEGDRYNLLYAAQQKGIQYGTFVYTKDYELLDMSLQQSEN